MITLRFLGRLFALAVVTTATLLAERWLVPSQALPLVILATLALALLVARFARDIWRDDRADYRTFRNFRMPDDARRVRWGLRTGKEGDQ
jgi:hypothetical protein